MKFASGKHPRFVVSATSFMAQSIAADSLMAGVIKRLETKLANDGLLKIAAGHDWSEWVVEANLSQLELSMLATRHEPVSQYLPRPASSDKISMCVANSDGTPRES